MGNDVCGWLSVHGQNYSLSSFDRIDHLGSPIAQFADPDFHVRHRSTEI